MIGAWNRWCLADDFVAERSNSSKRSTLRLIALEGALAVTIFGLVASWRFTPPPRALAASVESPRSEHIHIHSDKAMADVTVIPGVVGAVSISISILDHCCPVKY
jgi:copper transport protein